jgi:hypothetical protein
LIYLLTMKPPICFFCFCQRLPRLRFLSTARRTTAPTTPPPINT